METITNVAGIDIGGTNTVCGIIDVSGKVVGKAQFKTASMASYPEYASKLAETVKNLADNNSVELKGVGIGAPNANYYTGNIETAANLPWKGTLRLKDDMENNLGIPVTITNDANAAAHGELIFGAARGMKNFIMLTLGTGVGSGIVIGGRVLYGHTGFAGELGHVIMVENGRTCGCGRKGCLEAYASATGIVKTAIEFLEGGNNPSSLRSVQGEKLNSYILSQHAKSGDPIALKTFDVTARMLAIAITNSVLFSSPEAIILSGGLSRAGTLLTDPLAEYIDDFIMPVFRGSFQVLHTALPESDAAILGAASLAIA